MWLDLAGTAQLEGDPRAPALERLLLVAQQALDSGLLGRFEVVRVVHIVSKAIPGPQLQSSFVRSPRGAALIASWRAPSLAPRPGGCIRSVPLWPACCARCCCWARRARPGRSATPPWRASTNCWRPAGGLPATMAAPRGNGLLATHAPWSTVLNVANWAGHAPVCCNVVLVSPAATVHGSHASAQLRRACCACLVLTQLYTPSKNAANLHVLRPANVFILQT